MPDISLTNFVDFTLKSGSPRLTYIKRAKALYEDGYSPAFDYWRTLRHAIIEMHSEDLGKRHLDAVRTKLSDTKKIHLYSKCIVTYKRWMGRKEIEWIGVRSTNWTYEDLIVRINPELGLSINGANYLIKLYFRREPLSQRRLDITLHLLQMAISGSRSGLLPAVIDVQRGKLFTPTMQIPDIDALLSGEAAAFITMWNQI